MKIAQFSIQSIMAFALVLATTTAHAGTPPIVGPDDFEPDDVPLKARFLALDDENNNTRKLLRRNFDRPDDVDWAVVNVRVPLFVFVRTTALFSRADTVISVFRLVTSDGTAGDDPLACDGSRLRFNADRDLLNVACNDDVSVGELRSEVSFDVDTPGIYFIRISNKPVAEVDDKIGEEQTTYGIEATYFGVVPGGIVASVFDAESSNPITTAIVREQTLGFSVNVNTNGVYNLGALSADTYSLKVEAPGYVTQSQSVNVADGGSFQDVPFAMLATAPQHALDYALPVGDISLAELLRAIQFYNIGEFGCDPETEDNFAPGVGGRSCASHTADYNPQDWKLNLGEILRLIQLYNATNGFEACQGGEDGFCPLF